LKFKVVLLGEGRVGKTSLTLKYVKGTFSDRQESTIQATFLAKRINISKQSMELNIWDTAGQERFHALAPIYYRNADGALLVYDITDRDSFTKVRNWVKELRKFLGHDISLLIVGNKIDMERDRQVDEKQALDYAASVGAKHVTCSARTGKDVETVFLELAKAMLQKHQAKPEPSGGNSSRRNVLIAADDEPKSGCSC